ncbi:MAG: hypothetical protein K8R88_02100 [Armatimonadetes bacterium]|nr:hypothetical protein [Armatimonadota bacterium]
MKRVLLIGLILGGTILSVCGCGSGGTVEETDAKKWSESEQDKKDKAAGIPPPPERPDR